jgi:hypothetical protein
MRNHWNATDTSIIKGLKSDCSDCGSKCICCDGCVCSYIEDIYDCDSDCEVCAEFDEDAKKNLAVKKNLAELARK